MNQTPTELLAPYNAAVVAAVQELLRISSTAATIFRVPGTEPEQIILAGEIEALNKLLESQESVLPVSWHKLGAGPRSWTIVLSADSGVVGELGCKFEKVPERLERVDVVEAAPLLRELGQLQRENAELLARAEMTEAARDVLAERRRQVEAEGWTPAHDDAYAEGELARAAACYALEGDTVITFPPEEWPWPESWWKPADDRRNLVKAGALILAAIERLDRAGQQSQTHEGSSQACTCPSGDGSLRWPCPTHPSEAKTGEQSDANQA